MRQTLDRWHVQVAASVNMLALWVEVIAWLARQAIPHQVSVPSLATSVPQDMRAMVQHARHALSENSRYQVATLCVQIARRLSLLRQWARRPRLSAMHALDQNATMCPHLQQLAAGKGDI